MRSTSRYTENQAKLTARDSRRHEIDTARPHSHNSRGPGVFGDVINRLNRITPPPDVSTASEITSVTSTKIVSNQTGPTIIHSSDQGPQLKHPLTHNIRYLSGSSTQITRSSSALVSNKWTKMNPLNARDALLRPLDSRSSSESVDEPLFLPAGADRTWYLGFLERWPRFQQLTVDFWKSQCP